MIRLADISYALFSVKWGLATAGLDGLTYVSQWLLSQSWSMGLSGRNFICSVVFARSVPSCLFSLILLPKPPQFWLTNFKRRDDWKISRFLVSL